MGKNEVRKEEAALELTSGFQWGRSRELTK